MQIIDPNKPYFVDRLPSPNTVAQKQSMAFGEFQNTKNYFSITFLNISFSPYELFSVEAYNANPTKYDTAISVNSWVYGGKNYSYILNLISNNAINVKWIKVSWRFKTLAANPQLNQPLIYTYKDANGQTQTDQLLGYEDLDPYQKTFENINIDLQGDDSILLDGNTFLTYQWVEDPAPQGATFCFYYDQALQGDVLDEMREIDQLLNF